MKKQINKSNGYSARRFFSFPKNGTIPASYTLPTPTYTDSFICWSPVLKKYFFADVSTPNKVYSQSPDGQKTVVHTASSNNRGIHWSNTLQKLVLFCNSHIYTSDDGVVWTSRTLPADYALNSNISSFVDASTYLLMFGREDSTGYMYKTTDGITWTRSASGTGSSVSVVAGAIGDTVGYCDNNSSSSNTIRYTSNGTTYASATGPSAGSVAKMFPPTTVRPIFISTGAGDGVMSSADGITYTSTGVNPATSTAGLPQRWFGGLMLARDVGVAAEYFSFSSASPAFMLAGSGYGVYPVETFVSIEGEYATYTRRTRAHRVGTWLDIGEHEVWLIGGGAPNADTSVGGTAGFLTIHRMTVTEKHRYCVYVYLGAAAIVDTLTGEFLAYASMLTSTSTSSQVNTAGFGSECYPGLGASTSYGAACGPSNGGAAFLGPASTGGASGFGCATRATTTATTPPDWWTPWDFAGNPSGTGYPGTGGQTFPTIGFMGGPTATTITGSFGSGGCNQSNALSTVGGEPLAIIYSR